MDIIIEDDKLRKLCEDDKLARKEYGDAAWKKLRARLADLRAAFSVRDLVAGSPHPLKGDRAGQLALTVYSGLRLVFEPANEPRPERPDGGIDWSQVTRVRIVYIGDYHD
jgi:toxin HigB-1